MKTILKMMLVVATLLILMTSQVWAYSFSDIDDQNVVLNINFNQEGGYGVKLSDSDEILFYTFCLEKDVNFYYTNETKPDSLSYRATVDENVLTAYYDSTENRGAVSSGTKYLYWNFVHNQDAFSSLSWGNHSSTDQVTAMQEAIWRLQQGEYDHGYSEDLSGLAAKLYGLAGDADGSGFDVRAMNLWDTASGGAARQSQLIAGPAPVPEPSTMLLLGSGLVGLALYRRRRK